MGNSTRGGSVTSLGTILIVDDSEESLRLLSDILGSEGYDVRPADSGELALAAISASQPELILLDMRMPDMDGLKVCRQIKARPESCNIPVIFLSGSIDFADKVESLESGAVDFINKPFRREELLARLRTHLELSRLRNELERRVMERTSELKNAYDQIKVELVIRKRIAEELRESEQLFRSMADTAPVGIWIADQSGLITYLSQWGLEFSGWTQDQLAGEGWHRLLHPEDGSRAVEAIVASTASRSAFQIEFRLQRSDGTYRWVAMTGTPRFLHGEFAGHIGSIVDITELKRMQEHSMTVQKLESLGVLAAGIAHDFNNLLSTILAYSDLAIHEIPVNTQAHKSVSSIATVAVRASEIVKLLLTYAGQADAGVPQPVDLTVLITEMVDLLKVSVFKTTTLQTDLGKELQPIAGNPGQIRQVLLNLVMNASDALQERPGTIVVSTSLAPADQPLPPGLADGDYVRLTVSDNGCGMTEETRNKIFDPFFSTKFLGRGLGLASVQGIIRSTHGAITVSSTPGQGSIFTVWLPVWHGTPEHDKSISGIHSSTSYTVLLVDDEDGLRLAVTSALKREGFSVIAASDGLVATQLFSKHSSEINVVVLDLTLPGLNGREVAAEIHRIRPDVPVLFTSAQSFAGSDAIDASGPFLQKPYRLRELIGTIREMVASAGVE